MKHKKILHITAMTSTKYGAYEKFLIDLIELSNRLGYSSALQYEAKPTSQSYLKELKKLDAQVLVCPVNRNPFESFYNILRIIISIHPEIIHTHFVEGIGLFLIPMLGRLLGARRIINTVNYKRWGSNKYQGFAYNKYDHVLACSQAVKDDLIQRGAKPENLTVQYLGINDGHIRSLELRAQIREKFNIPQQAIVLACIAFDTEFKGLDILLEAFARIAKRQYDLHLLSIGLDPKQSKLPDFANQLGLSERVHWAGIVDEGWKILNAADVYVQPSRFGEGLSLSILEAMAMQLPIVCTKVAGNGEAVIDGINGALAEPGNAESLASALECMISNIASWPELGKAGYSRYKELFQGKKLREELVAKYYAK